METVSWLSIGGRRALEGLQFFLVPESRYEGVANIIIRPAS